MAWKSQFSYILLYIVNNREALQHMKFNDNEIKAEILFSRYKKLFIQNRKHNMHWAHTKKDHRFQAMTVLSVLRLGQSPVSLSIPYPGIMSV